MIDYILFYFKSYLNMSVSSYLVKMNIMLTCAYVQLDQCDLYINHLDTIDNDCKFIFNDVEILNII
jgi:hypothetical protein